MKNRQFMTLGAAATAMVMLVSACGSGGGSTASKSSDTTSSSLNIAYANITSKNPSLKGVADRIQSAGKVSGDKVSLYDNQSDPAQAVKVARLMVADKPDVILDWSPAPQIGNSLSAIFQRADVPCISVNIQIPKCPWFNLDNPKLGTKTGKKLATQMKAKGWDGTNTTFVIAQNSKVGAENNSLERSGYLAVADALPGFKKTTLDKITASTTTISKSAVQVDTGDAIDTAYSAMKNALQTIPASRHIVVYGITDESTLGAERALKGAGRTDVLLAGNGGDEAGLKELRSNPAWVAESSSFVPQWGEYLMAMSHAVTSGMTLPGRTLAPMAVITKDNVDKYYKPGGAKVKMLPPLAKEDQYLAKTGVLQKFKNVSGL